MMDSISVSMVYSLKYGTSVGPFTMGTGFLRKFGGLAYIYRLGQTTSSPDKGLPLSNKIHEFVWRQ